MLPDGTSRIICMIYTFAGLDLCHAGSAQPLTAVGEELLIYLKYDRDHDLSDLPVRGVEGVTLMVSNLFSLLNDLDPDTYCGGEKKNARYLIR